MLTSVFREILYHSLNGDRTYGGTLSVDGLIVPTELTSDYEGTGSIDGTEFQIGWNKTIACVVAQSIVAKSISGSTFSNFSVRNSAGSILVSIGHSGNNSYVELIDADLVTQVFLKPVLSYIKTKLIVGGDESCLLMNGDPLPTPSVYKFISLGGSYFEYPIMKLALVESDVTVGGDVFASPYTLKTVGAFVTDGLTPFYDNLYPLHLENLTEAIVTELSHIEDATFDNNQWDLLANAQNVAVGANPVFGTVTADDISADSITSTGGVNPNAAPDTYSAYFIKKYEEREYVAPFAFTNDLNVWTGNVSVRFVVIGKQCSFYIIPKDYVNGGGGEVITDNAEHVAFFQHQPEPDTAISSQMYIDLSDSKFSKIYQAVDAYNSIIKFSGWYGGLYTNSALVSFAAFPPMNQDGGKTLIIGLAPLLYDDSYLIDIPFPAEHNKYIRFHPPVFTWLTE